MTLKWYHNAKIGEVGSYEDNERGRDKVRSLAYICGDSITVGFENREAAIKWANEYGYCKHCDSARKGEACILCSREINHVEVKEVSSVLA